MFTSPSAELINLCTSWVATETKQLDCLFFFPCMFSFANLQTNLPRTEGPWTPSLILSRLHHMTLNLCINEPLYALERSGERCALSNHFGSSPRAAFYLLSTFLACKQKLIHSQFLVIFTHCYAKKTTKAICIILFRVHSKTARADDCLRVHSRIFMWFILMLKHLEMKGCMWEVF